MKCIRKPDASVMGVWRSGQAQEQQTYRQITYVVQTAHQDGLLLYHLVTGELLSLTEEEGRLFASLPGAYAPWMQPFIEKRFLVPTDARDSRTVDSLRSALRQLGKPRGITRYTISPTTACNARCFYCFEQGWRSETMTEETADIAAAFIRESCRSEPVNIAWFGGEPLLGAARIDRICRGLSAGDVEFSSVVTSNGYLFTEELARRARELWHVRQVMITLDGTEAVYNETKAYINPCESPYRRVLENIGHLLHQEIHVLLRLNIGVHNYEDLAALIREVDSRFPEKTHLSAYVRQLYDNCGTVPTDFEAKENLLFPMQERLEEQLRACGLMRREPLPGLRLYHCKADRENFAVIHPSGKLSKCEHNHDARFVGTVWEGITDIGEVRRSRQYAVPEACPGCPLYPTCLSFAQCEVEERCSPGWMALRYKAIREAMVRAYEAGETD